jgi:hypothetical protein
MLYAYAHTTIQQMRLDQHSTKIQAVITSVNPNLGFKGSAFRAVGFRIVGEKPTAYYYLTDNLGQRSFISRRSLVDLLHCEPKTTKYTKALFPLLPTKELVTILDDPKRSRPITSVYSIGESEYSQEAPILADVA